MAKILFVKPIPTRKRVELGIEENEGEVLRLKVREKTYASLGSPIRGSKVEDEVLERLKFDDELIRAYTKAVMWLSDVDKSRFELTFKLRHLGFSEQAIKTALDKCEEYGYLDEERQLERLIEREANRKLRGRYYIKRKLMSKGYRPSAIDRMTDRLLEGGEIDFIINFEMLKEKRGAQSEEEITALKYKYGYKI